MTTITSAAYNCETGTEGSLDATISGGIAPYNFLWSNDSTSEDISGLLPGEYTLNVTDAEGCITSEIGHVSTTGYFTFTWTNSEETICSGESLPLVAPAGYAAYLWSTGETGTNQIYAEDADKYWVNITASTGCQNLPDTVTLIVDPTPDAPAASGVSVCSGASVPNLEATGTNIRWYDKDMNLLFSGSPYATGKTELGTYSYYVTQTSGSCESEPAQVILSINALPSSVDLADTVLCENDTLRISVAAESGHSYTWLVAGITDPVSSTEDFEAAPLALTEYVFRDRIDSSGCEAYDTFAVSIEAIPVFSCEVINDVINAGSYATVTLTEGYTYTFMPGGNVTKVTGTVYNLAPTENTDFMITGSTTAGCSSDTAVSIYVYCHACTDTTLFDTTGTFNHGCTNRNYRNSAHCSWTIFPSGQVAGIEIVFDTSSFDIRSGDELRVYQGTGDNGTLEGAFDNDHLPSDTMIVVGNAAYVEFVSDLTETGSGFQAEYRILHELGIHDYGERFIKIYPNPNRGTFTLEMDQVRFSKADVEIFSALGQKIWNRTIWVQNGSVSETIELPGIPEGVYYLRITSEEAIFNRTIIKE